MASRTDSGSVGVAHQIPRNALAMLMVAQVVVFLPLAPHISPWIGAVCLFCGYWRTQVHRGRWGYPSATVKAVLVVASFAGIGLSGYRSFTLEAATSLLVLAFALKLVEMKSRRDAYLVVYLSYFLVATAFLYDQTIALTAYELVAAVVVTGALVGMNQLQSRVRPLASLWTAASLVLQALPLTLVLFMLFPRIAPLWSIPMPSATSTGLSDHLTPGDVANLTRSDELAFRAVFDGPVPPQRELYWRALVYSNFRQGTWSVAAPLPALSRGGRVVQGLAYEVFMEPTQSKWLYSLDTPVVYGPRMDLLPDYRLVNAEPVLSVMRYRLVSDPDLKRDAEFNDFIEYRETAIPDDNPRLQTYARELFERAGSVRAMIDAMMLDIRTQPYSYTLNPPQLPGEGSIDRFWFETRAGFCTHYAGAMVFALRSVGVPARLVGGYQGGEVNPVTGHLVVRQYQAHAWVEAWLPEQGWTRFDPTAAVAPERVEDGLNAALSSEDRAALSFLAAARMGNTGLVNAVLLWADSMEYRWNLWVVGYDATVQADVLRDLLGKVTPARIGGAIIVGGGASLALVSLALFWRRRPSQRHPVERLFQAFCRRMARQGLAREPGETPSGYIDRLARLAQIDASDTSQALQALLYDPTAARSRSQTRQLQAQLRMLRFRLVFGTARAGR